MKSDLKRPYASSCSSAIARASSVVSLGSTTLACGLACGFPHLPRYGVPAR